MYPASVKVSYTKLLNRNDRVFTATSRKDILLAISEVGLKNICELAIKPIGAKP